MIVHDAVAEGFATLLRRKAARVRANSGEPHPEGTTVEQVRVLHLRVADLFDAMAKDARFIVGFMMLVWLGVIAFLVVRFLWQS